MKRALDSTTQTGLRQRIRHRLRARDSMVTPKERAFIESIDDLLTQGNILSDKQIGWLLDILDRTEKAAKTGEVTYDDAP